MRFLNRKVRVLLRLILTLAVSIATASASENSAHHTLAVYPARWVLQANPDTLVVPHLKIADLKEDSWTVVALESGGRACIVSPKPIFTDQDIDFSLARVGTTSEASERKLYLDVHLKPGGLESLSSYSSQQENIGQPIAMKYNDRWLSFPALQAHIKSGRSVIFGLKDDELAQILAAHQKR